MSLTQQQLDGICPTGNRAIAYYRLNYGTLPSGTLEDFGSAITGIIEDLLRRIMFPFLEPANRPGPNTVYCDDEVGTAIYDDTLCEESCSNAGVTWGSYSTNDARYAACVAVWLG